jgi:hypothetical protein
MRHPLASHFRGTFVGVCLGEAIAVASQKQCSRELSDCQLVMLGTKYLIEQGRLDLERWQELPEKHFSHLDISFADSYRVILATLPVALFFHDNCLKLRHTLLDLFRVWQVKGVWRDVTLAFAYAIAQSITEKLDSSTLISQTTSFIGETSSLLPQKLLKLNYLLEQQAGLGKVKTELGTMAEPSSMMAMVFYCCLSTIEDFHLAVLRSQQTSNSQSIPTLVAVLCGANNGTLGIPASWQAYLSSPQLSQQGEFEQMLTLADGLLAQWSGLYELGCNHDIASGAFTEDSNVVNLQAIASPNIMR